MDHGLEIIDRNFKNYLITRIDLLQRIIFELGTTINDPVASTSDVKNKIELVNDLSQSLLIQIDCDSKFVNYRKRK